MVAILSVRLPNNPFIQEIFFLRTNNNLHILLLLYLAFQFRFFCDLLEIFSHAFEQLRPMQQAGWRYGGYGSSQFLNLAIYKIYVMCFGWRHKMHIFLHLWRLFAVLIVILFKVKFIDFLGIRKSGPMQFYGNAQRNHIIISDGMSLCGVLQI